VASIVHVATSVRHPLAPRSLIGRSSACVVRHGASHVSAEHAALAWTDGNWELRDLGSRNGTFVNGERIEPGSPVVVDHGSRIAFGAIDDVFDLDDASPPGAVAIDLATGAVCAGTGADGDLLALPDEADPEVSIYRDTTDAWMEEHANGEVRRAIDQEVIVARGRAFRIHLPVPMEETPIVYNGPTIETISLRLAVSSDEETVEMTVIHRGKEIPLEAREHGYVILTLARIRQADAAKPQDERGWIERDRLLKMLHTDSNGFNVAVHRARQQLLSAGVRGAAGIVEVKRGLRRRGIENVTIGRLVDA
jgi:hypothetical protein